MHVDASGRVPLKIWAEGVEEGALEQARHLTELPFAFKHVALMADCHSGYGMPIGGVLATKNVVVPYAVGVDIGCGMSAWKTGLTVEEFMPKRHEVMQLIQKTIPVGFNKHGEQREGWYDWTTSPIRVSTVATPVVNREYHNSLYQLGTLGGGNHFIEIQKDEEDNVWAMIHSGSRNLGKQVCDYYNKLAVKLNDKWFSQVPKEWELAFLPVDSDEGQSYIDEMGLCLDFAKKNRRDMMVAVHLILMDRGFDVGVFDLLDAHHNYVAIENHYGANVWVHRKGAVKAVGTVIIPGSMGSSSYIAEGLENPESFKSCSHGAGRAMGRKAAVRDLSEVSERQVLDSQDIKLYGGGRGNEWLAEARGSYKDIDVVMENQKDLVRITKKLTPLAVLKA
jgi:tRNA-splicing ligase RtcB (3'-phosphate/5'-hydroxy nucleic acid ligase)